MRIDCDGDGAADLLFPAYHEGPFSQYLSPEMGSQLGMIGVAISLKAYAANKNFPSVGVVGGAGHTTLWSFTAGAMVNAHFASSEDGRLYLASHDDHLYALDLKSGKTLWSHDLKGNIVSLSGAREEAVAVSAKNLIAAFRSADGATLWSRPIKMGIVDPSNFGALLADEKTVYVADLADRVFALERATGRERWAFDSKANASLLLLTRGLLLVAIRKEVVALETSSGAVRWRMDAGGYVLKSSIVELEDRIVLRQASGEPALMAIDPQGGRILWSLPYDKTVRDRERTVVLPEDAAVQKTSLLMAEGAEGRPRALFAAQADAVMAVRPDDGKILWSAPVPGTQVMLVSGGRLVAADKKRVVHSLDAADGTEKWRHEADWHVAQMERLGAHLLATLYSGDLLSLRFEDGGSPAVIPLGEPYRLVPTAADRVIVCGASGTWEYTPHDPN
jgi:outer membrane protein assembly factor BamB